jgi:hypothetical protein
MEWWCNFGGITRSLFWWYQFLEKEVTLSSQLCFSEIIDGNFLKKRKKRSSDYARPPKDQKKKVAKILAVYSLFMARDAGEEETGNQPTKKSDWNKGLKMKLPRNGQSIK